LAKLPVAAGVFFAVLEVTHFALADRHLSSFIPSDAFGPAICRDFVNTWMGGRSAFSSGRPWAARASGVERNHTLFLAVAPGVAVNVFFNQNRLCRRGVAHRRPHNLDPAAAARRDPVRHPHSQTAIPDCPGCSP
jgi:hypothetical protein